MNIPTRNSVVSRETVLEAVTKTIKYQLDDSAPAEISETQCLAADLGLDSLDVACIWLELENELGVEIPEKDFEQFATDITIGQVVDTVLPIALNHATANEA